MSRKLPAIPDVQLVQDPAALQVLSALKESIEQLTARRGAPIAKLGPTSSLAQVIVKINEILDKFQI